MNDIVLPQPGSRWRIGETTVIVNDTSKRGRGYQVHVRTDADPTPHSMRLKDFVKKATVVPDA
jgi:hypothetical protein